MKSQSHQIAFRIVTSHPECLMDDEVLDPLIDDIALEIERLQTENWQLKQACGYPIPADKETPQNPFKCGICDARSTLTSG